MGSAPASPSQAPPGWWRLEMACPPELEESLLWKLPCLGVTRVAVRHTPSAPDVRTLVAWLPASDWPAAQRSTLQNALAPLGEPFGLPLPPLRWHPQPEEDWSLSWKSHWRPDPVGKRLLILPAWLEAPPEFDDRLVLRLDPGSAFGTGSHPTTRLCLEALEDLAADGGLEGARVADLGCGSGILSLAALALGASPVAAADTDSLAVRATRENAHLNGWPGGDGDGPLRVAQGSLEALTQLLENRPADMLLCNILAPVIGALCPGFHRLLAPGGVGILSGVLVDQVPALVRTLEAAGWGARLQARQDPWGLLLIRSVARVP